MRTEKNRVLMVMMMEPRGHVLKSFLLFSGGSLFTWPVSQS